MRTGKSSTENDIDMRPIPSNITSAVKSKV